MGRLFDAVSSLAGVCHRVAYEAEAAMCFEGLARAALDESDAPYSFGPVVLRSSREPDTPTRQVDAAPVIRAVVADVRRGVPTALIAARFHLAVAALVRDLAVELRARTGLDTAALSGGVFLNVVLHTLCTDALAREGFRVLTHRQVPPSDAGLALGQLAIAARSTRPRENSPCV
jgi:hydrogenase maturation protein HypF